MLDKPKMVALVTGASSGIGKEIAKQLIADGYQVFVAARRVGNMEDLVKLGAKPLSMDLSKEEEIQAAVATILATEGRVDVLVNNAGFGLYGAIEDLGLDDARYQFEVNVFGPARLTQLLLPAMRRQGSGTIVNITSMGGKIYTMLGGWYHATKHALEGWSDCLRLELAPFGIRVVVVEPGLIETGFGEVVVDGLQKRPPGSAYSKVAQAVAKSSQDTYGHGRGTEPSVVADAVSKSIKSKNARTRYVVGKYAKPMIWMRAWLGDRNFDRVMRRMIATQLR